MRRLKPKNDAPNFRSTTCEEFTEIFSDWMREQSFATDGNCAGDGPSALDPDGYPYVVLAAGVLFDGAETDTKFILRLRRLLHTCQHAIQQLGTQSDLWVRRRPDMCYVIRPGRTPRGFQMADIWSHGAAKAILYSTVRLSRKDHQPIEGLRMTLKPEGAVIPVLEEDSYA